jgi:hypothetical protein
LKISNRFNFARQETEKRAQLEKIENDTLARKSAHTYRSMAMPDIE